MYVPTCTSVGEAASVPEVHSSTCHSFNGTSLLELEGHLTLGDNARGEGRGEGR